MYWNKSKNDSINLRTKIEGTLTVRVDKNVLRWIKAFGDNNEFKLTKKQKRV